MYMIYLFININYLLTLLHILLICTLPGLLEYPVTSIESLDVYIQIKNNTDLFI
jgi:hypothetical protein